MHIKTFTLKQHTPIIHFQHDEYGATLRASEVKPKLDKFLIGKFEKENINFRKWQPNEKHKALGYGLSFVAKGYNRTDIKHRNSPMYFGNMGDGKEKHLVFSDSLQGKIKCKHKKLLSHIEAALPEFFFLHNFGTRQSKGYGSFTVKSIEGVKIDFAYWTRYSFELTTPSWSVAMESIGLFYKSLRSGINVGIPKYYNVEGRNNRAIKLNVLETSFYLKPVIFLYAKEILTEQWDKKSIKEAYFSEDYYYRKATRKEKERFRAPRDKFLIETLGLKKQKESFDDSIPETLDYSSPQKEKSFRYNFRDLFGLSSHEDWKSYGLSIEKMNKNIDRFKSPIMFKPIYNSDLNIYNIYIHISEIPEEYKGQIFELKTSNTRGRNKLLQLQIPENFHFNSLFDFIENNLELDNYLHEEHQNYKGGDYYDCLFEIYSQLTNQNQ